MVPAALASRVGNYNVRIGEANVTVKMIKHPSLLAESLSELQTSLSERRVVGVDAESSVAENDDLRWVVLCAGSTMCLLIDLVAVGPTPGCLKSFLGDDTVCFVGLGMANQSFALRRKGVRIRTGMELGHLAALVNKDPTLEHCSSDYLVRQFGSVSSKKYKAGYRTLTESEWGVNVFSAEEMPRVVKDAYYSYVVGDKLLSTVF